MRVYSPYRARYLVGAQQRSLNARVITATITSKPAIATRDAGQQLQMVRIPTAPQVGRQYPHPHNSGRRIHSNKAREGTQNGARRARCALCWRGLQPPLPLFATISAPAGKRGSSSARTPFPTRPGKPQTIPGPPRTPLSFLSSLSCSAANIVQASLNPHHPSPAISVSN